MEKSFELAATFIAVVESQGFAKAARRLNVAASVVTRRINLLEDELEIQLLIRTTRKLSLTAAGEQFYQQAKRLHEEWQAFYQTLQDEDHSQTRGKIIIAASPTVSAHTVQELLFEFIDTYPKIEVEYYLSFEQIDLHTEQVDVVIGPDHMLRDKDEVIERKLKKLEFGVFAAPNYLKKHGTPKSITELEQHAAILWKKQFANKPAWNFPGLKLNYKTRFTTNNERLALEAASRGLGIIQLPLMAVKQALARKELVQILTEENTPVHFVQSYLFYVKKRFMPAHVRLFIDFLLS